MIGALMLPNLGWGTDTRSLTRRLSHDDGNLVACLADAPRDIHLGEQAEAHDEEDNETEDGQPVGAGQLERDRDHERTDEGGGAVADLVEPEVLRLTAERDELAEQRPGECLAAAEDDTDGCCEQEELELVPGGDHEGVEDDDRPDHERP